MEFFGGSIGNDEPEPFTSFSTFCKLKKRLFHRGTHGHVCLYEIKYFRIGSTTAIEKSVDTNKIVNRD